MWIIILLQQARCTITDFSLPVSTLAVYGQEYHGLREERRIVRRIRGLGEKNRGKKETSGENDGVRQERRVIKTIRGEERSFLRSSRNDGLHLDRDDATEAAFSERSVRTYTNNTHTKHAHARARAFT